MSTDHHPVDGRGAVRAWAPHAAEALDQLEAAVWHDVPIALADAAVGICASANRIAPLPRPLDAEERAVGQPDVADWRSVPGGLPDVPAAAAGFAEQFAVDVSALTGDQRGALFATLADQALPFAQVVYVADVIGRARAALDRLFGPSAPSTPRPASPLPLGDAMNELIRVVPGLQELDPVLTELVRLRGARQHNCRVCQSLRSHSAFLAGADDAMFDAVDDHANSPLSDAQKVALRFTDAFIWTPGAIDDELVETLRAHYSASQQVELVLDIARNASNKLAVALGADGTDVTEGYAVYDVAPDGSITYGLTKPG